MDNKPGCLGIILQALGLLPKNVEVMKNDKYPYAKRDDFLSDAELSFYKVLDQVIGEQAIICPKVSLNDVLFISSGDRSERQIYLNKISRKHVDFLICTNDKLKVLCGIELDDSSHQRADRIVRDEFVEKAFEAAGLKLIRFENKRMYSLSEVELKIASAISINKNSNESVSIEANDITEQIPVCPKCGIPMVLRKAKSGDNKGQEFYGCSNYPKCKEIINIT